MNAEQASCWRLGGQKSMGFPEAGEAILSAGSRSPSPLTRSSQIAVIILGQSLCDWL